MRSIFERLKEDAIQVERKSIHELGLPGAIILQTIKDLEIADKVVTFEMLEEELGMLFGNKTLKRNLDKLVNVSYITIDFLSSREKLDILLTKDLKGLGIGDKQCPICDCKTLTLHEHHYPIQKCYGGEEVISICPTCHYEYHHLSTTKIIKSVLVKEVI